MWIAQTTIRHEMNSLDYVKNVLVTETRDLSPVAARIAETRNLRLIHATAGIVSEVAELVELSNKSWNGRDSVIDRVNLMEECGDILWYVGIACDELGCVDRVMTSSYQTERVLKFDDDLNDALYNTASRLAEHGGKLADLTIKKFVFYGKPFDAAPIMDLLSKTHKAVDGLLQQAGYTIEDARERNIAKLKARYGDKFTEAAALERDLENERKVLENK